MVNLEVELRNGDKITLHNVKFDVGERVVICDEGFIPYDSIRVIKILDD